MSLDDLPPPLSTEDLLAEIRRVFHGVALGTGRGLWEAQAFDDYADKDDQGAARKQDEKLDWSAIVPSTLARCHDSLCFFDADGMRFHLPAFLVAEIDGALDMSPIFSLTHCSDYTKSQFASLNDNQRRCVIHFLKWCLPQDRYCGDRREIEEALRDYWNDLLI